MAPRPATQVDDWKAVDDWKPVGNTGAGEQSAAPGFLKSAWNAVNPAPAIKEWVNRPQALRDLAGGAVAGTRAKQQHREPTPEEQSAIDRGMSANVSAPGPNLAGGLLSPTLKAVDQARRGEYRGAAGTFVGGVGVPAALMALGGPDVLDHSPSAPTDLGARLHDVNPAGNPLARSLGERFGPAATATAKTVGNAVLGGVEGGIEGAINAHNVAGMPFSTLRGIYRGARTRLFDPNASIPNPQGLGSASPFRGFQAPEGNTATGPALSQASDIPNPSGLGKTSKLRPLPAPKAAPMPDPNIPNPGGIGTTARIGPLTVEGRTAAGRLAEPELDIPNPAGLGTSSKLTPIQPRTVADPNIPNPAGLGKTSNVAPIVQGPPSVNPDIPNPLGLGTISPLRPVAGKPVTPPAEPPVAAPAAEPPTSPPAAQVAPGSTVAPKDAIVGENRRAASQIVRDIHEFLPHKAYNALAKERFGVDSTLDLTAPQENAIFKEVSGEDWTPDFAKGIADRKAARAKAPEGQ